MAKRRGIKRIFRKTKRSLAQIVSRHRAGVPPAHAVVTTEEKMPLPLALGTVVRFAPSLIRAAGRRIATVAPGIASAVTGITGRKRRRASLSGSEMGKLVFMSQVLGKRNPAVTLMVMRALGGRL